MKRNAVAWAALVVSTAALVSSRSVSRPGSAAPGIPAESQRTARALSDAFVAVADFAKPSVVQISVERKASGNSLRLPNRGGNNPFQSPDGRSNKDLEDFFDMLRRFNAPNGTPEKNQFGGVARGTGSGFVYDDSGHILTNNHVVSSAGKIVVTFHDGVEASATVVGTDPKSDVAVIKVDNTSYRPLPKGVSSKLRVGDLVMAVGSPFGLSQSVTTGIVSATDRTNLGINEGHDGYESFIQTDAPINPGNSGGPLVDMDGHVIGINSAIMTGGRMMGAGGNDGVGFAIPIDLASNVADKLIKNGKVSRALLGVGIQPLVPAMASNLGLDRNVKGALVGEVVPGSAADKAGLKQGDVIARFNGKDVVNAAAFRLDVAASEIGKPYSLGYYRNGKLHSTEVVLGSADTIASGRGREELVKKPEEKPKPSTTAIDEFGLEVQPLTSDLAKGLGLPADTKGLLVSSVKEGSPAEAAGLERGVVITQMTKDKRVQPVNDVKSFRDAAAAADDLMVYVKTPDGKGGFLTLSKAKK